MNVFILTTGRCGSLTFSKACQHFTNYTAAHESRLSMIGSERFDYPNNHIECDNRLSWHLGRLDEKYGNDAFYVHLTRDVEKVAASYARRWRNRSGIVAAYYHGIVGRARDTFGDGGFPTPEQRSAVCKDYCETVNSNIRLFLKDKTNWMSFTLENATKDFETFIERIGAEGNLEAAIAEWNTAHHKGNTTPPGIPVRIVRKFQRVVKEGPRFLREI